MTEIVYTDELEDDELLANYHNLSQDITMGGETKGRRKSFEALKSEMDDRGLDPNDYFAGEEVNW